MKKSLYTDKNTEEDIEKLSETDSDSVIYNLYEDILILKEQLAQAQAEIVDLDKKIADTCARHPYQSVIDLAQALLRERKQLNKNIESLREQLASELEINKTLNSLMISGEKRGVQKATEEFKEQLAQAQAQAQAELVTAKADGIREAIIECGVRRHYMGFTYIDEEALLEHLYELDKANKNKGE
jgi:stalled ribosome rescue protein Dom34